MKNCFPVVKNYLYAILIGVAFCIPAQANVSPSLEQTLTQQINAKDFTAARATLANHPHNQAEELLLEGRIAKAKGDHTTAISLLEQSLRLQSYDLRIRRELAHTLYIAGKTSKARYHLEQLLQTDRDANLRNAYRNLLAQISQKNPINWSLFFAIEPSTNLNNGSGKTVIETSLGDLVIDDGSKAKSGVGLTFGVSGSTTLRATKTARTQLNWSLSQTKRLNDHDYSKRFGYLGVSFISDTARMRWQIDPFVKREWNTHNSAYVAPGMSISALKRFNKRSQLRLSLHGEKRDFRTNPINDGWYRAATISYERQINPSFGIATGLQFDASRPAREHTQYNGTRIFLSAQKSWQNGFSLLSDVHLGTRMFEGVFPLTLNRRQDKFGGISFTARNTKWHIGGFSPLVDCSFEKHLSNVALYEYDVTGCGLRFSRRF